MAWAPDLPRPAATGGGPDRVPLAQKPPDRESPDGQLPDGESPDGKPPAAAGSLAAWAGLAPLMVLRQLRSTPRGLTEDDAQARLALYGDNAVAFGRPPRWARQLLGAAHNPFVLVLLGLAGVSAAVGNTYSVAVISVLVIVACVLRVRQERRSGRAAAALRALVASTATVIRRAAAGTAAVAREVPVDQVVPGDIVELARGDLVPADLYLLRGTDLSVSQAVLTGESAPAGKRAAATPGAFGESDMDGSLPGDSTLPDCPWLCLAGSGVASGAGVGVVVATGPRTYFGATHRGQPERAPETCFDRGVKDVSWTLIRFMLVSIALVMAVTVTVGGNTAEAFLFVVSVAVGLTPEMLPVVVDTALARGGRVMASLGVIVKRLPAIHNLGAMDVLCTDKTGTLTEGTMCLDFSVDPRGEPDPAVLRLACLNSYWAADATGGAVNDALDEALLTNADEAGEAAAGDLADDLTRAGVIPFDHRRRRVSVVLRRTAQPAAHLMITKGAPAEVLACCTRVQAVGGAVPLSARERARLTGLADAYAAAGVRLLAVAWADVAPRSGGYRAAAEAGLTLAGFVGFRDRPKDSAAATLRDLARIGVAVKVITGDHPLVAARACRAAGLDPGDALLGEQVDLLTDAALAGAAASTVLFARIRPDQKARIVRALRASGSTVGYLGDGVNDVLPLREADVGISVESSVDIARESADVILARKDLTVLTDAVLRGRQTFGNIIKYIKITVSSNAGNVGSMLAAVAFLPFLPMLPLQVLVQNLCFDLTGLTLAFDHVADPSLDRPRTFDRRDLARFVICFGLVNMLADLATFAVLWRLGTLHDGATGRAVFRAAWFTENLITQAIAVLLLRARTGTPLRNRAAWPVLLGVAMAALVGLALPLSPLAAALAMHAPPLAYFPPLAAVLGGYCAMLLATRAVYVKSRQRWL
jgi:P-type Mg2+ transporter